MRVCAPALTLEKPQKIPQEYFLLYRLISNCYYLSLLLLALAVRQKVTNNIIKRDTHKNTQSSFGYVPKNRRLYWYTVTQSQRIAREKHWGAVTRNTPRTKHTKWKNGIEKLKQKWINVAHYAPSRSLLVNKHSSLFSSQLWS